jgi:S1-C subfamily serine protease
VKVEAGNGATYDAHVVRFDRRPDLARLHVEGLQLPPLAVANGTVGDEGAVFGHPGGGPLAHVPARIKKEVPAVINGRYKREAFELVATIKPGYSGGALVNRAGDAIGVAFAYEDGTSYAIRHDEVKAFLGAEDPGGPVDIGRCADPLGVSSRR